MAKKRTDHDFTGKIYPAQKKKPAAARKAR